LANKGIEISSGLLPSDIVVQLFGDTIGKQAVFLSGPFYIKENILWPRLLRKKTRASQPLKIPNKTI
jgi:hypothetical protein